MDTDSFIIKVTGYDVYELMKGDCKKQFDTSDYSPDNVYGIPFVNKKVLGMMKDEVKGAIIQKTADCGLKCMLLKCMGSSALKRRKGFGITW